MSEAKHLAASVAATERWIAKSRELRAVETRPGRSAFANRFAHEVDERWPNLDTDERQRRIRHLKSLYFARLRLRQLEQQRRARASVETARTGRERVSLAGIAGEEWGEPEA